MILLEILWLFCQGCICPQYLKVPPVAFTVVEFGLMVADPENVVIAMS